MKSISIKKMLIIALSAYFIGIIIADKFYKTPFRFVNFNDTKLLDKFLRNKFPVGSDVNELFKMLEQAGASCETYINRDNKLDEDMPYKYSYYCSYYHGFFSLHPINFYKIQFCSDENNKLVTPVSSIITELFNGI